MNRGPALDRQRTDEVLLDVYIISLGHEGKHRRNDPCTWGRRR
jgi:hypothetical protein